MTRFHATAGGNIAYTADEELAADAAVAAYKTEEKKRVVDAEITALELTITNRRLRDAMLGRDGGWLAGVDAQIAALRAVR